MGKKTLVSSCSSKKQNHYNRKIEKVEFPTMNTIIFKIFQQNTSLKCFFLNFIKNLLVYLLTFGPTATKG